MLPEPTDGRPFDLGSDPFDINAQSVVVGVASVYDTDPNDNHGVPIRWTPRG